MSENNLSPWRTYLAIIVLFRIELHWPSTVVERRDDRVANVVVLLFAFLQGIEVGRGALQHLKKRRVGGYPSSGRHGGSVLRERCRSGQKAMSKLCKG